jgi:hypothetical protein
MKYAEMGSISSGTMRPEDLIPCFLDELEALAMANDNKEDLAFIAEVRGRIEKTEMVESSNNEDHSLLEIPCDYYTSDDADFDLEELFDRLEAYALPYFYFGSHPGDGADYGFWLSEGFEDEFDGKKISDTSEVKEEDWNQEILHVNDHGNMTLYSCDDKGQLTEIWAIV